VFKRILSEGNRRPFKAWVGHDPPTPQKGRSCAPTFFCFCTFLSCFQAQRHEPSSTACLKRPHRSFPNLCQAAAA
jgi:hypothetical protein